LIKLYSEEDIYERLGLENVKNFRPSRDGREDA